MNTEILHWRLYDGVTVDFSDLHNPFELLAQTDFIKSIWLSIDFWEYLYGATAFLFIAALVGLALVAVIRILRSMLWRPFIHRDR